MEKKKRSQKTNKTQRTTIAITGEKKEVFDSVLSIKKSSHSKGLGVRFNAAT